MILFGNEKLFNKHANEALTDINNISDRGNVTLHEVCRIWKTYGILFPQPEELPSLNQAYKFTITNNKNNSL